jgi:adenylylsulfate kinase
MIYWFYGQSGAGKTTLARLVRQPAVLLDGDEMRGVWDAGFGRRERFAHNLRVARLAKVLEAQGHLVVVSTICPYRELREQIDAVCKPKWVYLSGGRQTDDEYPFEAP